MDDDYYEPVGYLSTEKCDPPDFPLEKASYPESGFIPRYGTLEYFHRRGTQDEYCKHTGLDGTVEWCTQVYYG